MIGAKLSYRERQRHANAIRRAEKEAWHREMVLIGESRRLAMQLAKDEVRAKGHKVTDTQCVNSDALLKASKALG